MSSFTIGATAATFTAVNSLEDKLEAFETYSIGFLCSNSTDFGALASLRSHMVNVRDIPGGSADSVVDVGWGPGVGTLVLDNFATYTAILTSITRNLVDSGAVHSVGTVTFLITA